VGIDWGDVPTWLGLLGAGVAFGVGLAQYRTAQAWKRAEFVASETKQFFDDELVATALLLVDYSVIRLDEQGQMSSKGHVFDDALLQRALTVHTKFADEIEKFPPDEMQARTAFDALLTGLERFDQYVSTELITVGDLKVHLDYWIDKLANPDSDWKPQGFYDAMRNFVVAYQYRGVMRLFERFGYPIPQSVITAVQRDHQRRT
jgi:hypothetical protein